MSESPIGQEPKIAPWVVIAGAAGATVGCYMPWLTAIIPLAGTVTRNGVDGGGDGLIVIALVGLAALVAIVSLKRRLAQGAGIAVILLGVAAFGIGVYDFVDLGDRIDALNAEGLGTASIGGGMFAVLGGTLGVVVGGLLMMIWRGSAVDAPEPAPEPSSLPVEQPAAMVATSAPQPGWYQDPYGTAASRWWSGSAWTETTRD